MWSNVEYFDVCCFSCLSTVASLLVTKTPAYNSVLWFGESIVRLYGFRVWLYNGLIVLYWKRFWSSLRTIIKSSEQLIHSEPSVNANHSPSFPGKLWFLFQDPLKCNICKVFFRLPGRLGAHTAFCEYTLAISRNSLSVQWLRLWVLPARSMGFISGWGPK